MYHVTAFGKNQCRSYGTEKKNGWNKDRIQLRSSASGIPHIFCDLKKSLFILFLNNHAFGGFYSCDPFIIGIGDLRVDLTDLSVPVKDPVLKEHSQHSNTGHDQKKQKGQTGIQKEHDAKHANHIDQSPEHVHQPPGDHSCNTQGIAHHTGMDISHRSGIIVRKG